MGLKSLSLLNKSGISMYWSNIWDSIKLYKKYSLSFFFLHDVIYYFLNENIYYCCFIKIKKKNLKGKKKNLDNFLDKNWIFSNLKNLYSGKILFLNYQNWTVVLINYYMLERKNILKDLEEVLFYNKVFKSIRKNWKNNFSNIDNYKYKF